MKIEFKRNETMIIVIKNDKRKRYQRYKIYKKKGKPLTMCDKIWRVKKATK